VKIKLEEMELFVAVVDTQSISRGAERLGLPKSNASRRLKGLEEKLNARLLERTTRRHKLTEAGQVFYQGCLKVLGESEALQNRVVESQQAMSGKLTVYAPLDSIRMLISSHLGEFIQQYPELEIEFLSGATRPHLLKDQIDVIIHLNDPRDSTFIARKLLDVPTSYYASPGYLEQHGTPHSPEQLLNHHCIVNLTQDREPLSWRYNDQGQIKTLPIKARYRSDSSYLSKTLMLQNIGISLVPCFLCEQEQRDGRLIQLFEGKHVVNDPLYALYPSREYVPEKTRTFLDFVLSIL
jgi:DNA-binding transcriptional LysR family regulator